MSIASRITSIEEHIGNAYDKLEDLGIDLTNTDKNIDNIASKLDELYEDYPKITATDTEATLNNTKAGRMEIGLKGNTSQATRILPTGYTQLDYIESTGTQSIGTSISGSGTWKLKIQGTQTTGATQIILGRASGRGHWFGVSSGGKYTLGGGVDTTKNYNELIEANIIVTDTDITLTIGNETVTRTNEYLVYSNYNLMGVDTFYSYVKMYRASFYQNNVLKNDLIPCKNSSNVIGMYDIVTNTFYQNAGTGTFTAGNTVTIPNPSYPQVIQNVSGNNTITISNADNTETQNLPVNLKSKNLFDKGDTSITYGGIQTSESTLNTGKRITALSTSGASSQYSFKLYKLLDLTNYVGKVVRMKTSFSKSSNILSPTYRIGLCDVNGGSRVNLANTNVSGTEISFTVPTLGTTSKYLAVWLYLSLDTDITQNDYVDFTDIIVTIDNADMTYDEYYNYKLANIGTAIDRFFKAVDGDEYYDTLTTEQKNALTYGKWYIHKEINKYVFTGNEEITVQATTTVKRNFMLDMIPDRYRGVANQIPLVLTTKFKPVKPSDSWVAGDISIGTQNASDKKVYLITEPTVDIAGLKTIIQGEPLYYALATPTNTEITETTLINQLEAILQAKSYNNQTNISQTNEDLPFILDLKALRGE